MCVYVSEQICVCVCVGTLIALHAMHFEGPNLTDGQGATHIVLCTVNAVHVPFTI